MLKNSDAPGASLLRGKALSSPSHLVTVSTHMSDAYQSGDRRPISSRDWKFSGLAARWLASRGVSPNAISVAGMVAGLAAGGCFALTIHLPHLDRLFWFIGAVCVQARLLANMLDGMVALESKRSSPIGELYNEVPDRISDAAALIGLGMASNLSLGFSAALSWVRCFEGTQRRAWGARSRRGWTRPPSLSVVLLMWCSHGLAQAGRVTLESVEPTELIAGVHQYRASLALRRTPLLALTQPYGPNSR
jgi:phosphatidylglycerophosphate synthase